MGSTEDDQPKTKAPPSAWAGERTATILRLASTRAKKTPPTTDDSADGNVDDSDDSEVTQEGGRRRRRGRRGRRRKDEGEEADNTVETAKGDVDPLPPNTNRPRSNLLTDEPDGKPAISPPDGTSRTRSINAESKNKPKRRRGRRSRSKQRSAGEKERKRQRNAKIRTLQDRSRFDYGRRRWSTKYRSLGKQYNGHDRFGRVHRRTGTGVRQSGRISPRNWRRQNRGHQFVRLPKPKNQTAAGGTGLGPPRVQRFGDFRPCRGLRWHRSPVLKRMAR